MSTRDLLQRTAEIASDYLDSLDERPVRPEATVDELRAALGGPLPEEPSDALEVIEELARDAEPGLMGQLERTVLRLRHRRNHSGGDRSRLARRPPGIRTPP